MAEFDQERRELVIKLVYYGPALSGKTTNLLSLHDRLNPQLKGELMTLETRGDRTLFFDLLPLGFRTRSGILVKFKLYTVPGQVRHDSTRKAVLSRADGVVFVADSQRQQALNNAESFQNLAENAQRVGLDFERLPLVVQFNKRDMEQILSEEEIRKRWSGASWPLHFSSAINGEGVKETYATLVGLVYSNIDPKYGLSVHHDVGREAFCEAALGEGTGS
ncbi:MAG: GTPase domain-containing protein [Gammaproteobacteria bacterium]